MDAISPPLGHSLADLGGVLLVAATILAFLVPMAILFPPFPPSKREMLQQTHSQVGLVSSKPKVKSSHRVLDKQRTDTSSSTGTIQSLWIYPIKSCRGVEVTQAIVRPEGLEYDRLFTFAQLHSPFPASVGASDKEKAQHKWEMLSQRQAPLLATIKVDLFVPDRLRARSVTGGGKVDDAGLNEPFVVMSFPWREDGFWGTISWLGAKWRGGLRAQPEMEVLLPVEFPTQRDIEEQGYVYEEVKIWSDVVNALNMEVDLPRELRLYLGVSNRLGLFRVDPNKLRRLYRCAPREHEVGYQPVAGFQDAYPVHIINQNSVDALESKIIQSGGMDHLDINRFRANVIFDGPEAYDEDSWRKIRLTQATASSSKACEFQVSCHTVRCKMPNVDQETGQRHPTEPDKSLRKYREIDAGAPKMGCLGMQLCPLFENTDSEEDMRLRIEVGMTIEVLERGEHRYIKI